MAPILRRQPGNGTPTDGLVPWSPQRLRLLLALGTVLAGMLVTGLGYAVSLMVTGAPSQPGPTPGTVATSGSTGPATATPTALSPTGAPPTAVSGVASAGGLGEARRDEIAAAPMMAVRSGDARAGRPAVPPAPAYRVPAARSADDLDVPTGFAHTPAGAVAQLAAIEVAVYARMDIAYTGAVHAAWTAPGAPALAQWPTTINVQAFLEAADVPGGRIDESVRMRVVPVAAMVKGVDGPDWVLACVLLDVSATIEDRARMGYGSCERMQWQPGAPSGARADVVGGRWVIGAGASPARAPSTWPGSQSAAAAGWLTWVVDGQDAS